MSTRTSLHEIEGYFKSLSNWGRWGEEDILGTLNYIGHQQRLAALGLAAEGSIVSCGRGIEADTMGNGAGRPLRLMVETGEGAPETGWGSAGEWIGMRIHGRNITHLDGLSHVFWNGKAYNGRSARDVTAERGARGGSIATLPGGAIAGRGVLLDVPRAEGISYVEPGTGISPDRLASCARRQGTDIEPGNIVLIRTGRDEAARQHGGSATGGRLAGLAPQCLPLLHEWQVALLGSDGVNDPRPDLPADDGVHLPIHAVGLVAMGMWLIDNLAVEELAAAATRLSRWAFTLVVTALKIEGGTGSPVNPIAIL